MPVYFYTFHTMLSTIIVCYEGVLDSSQVYGDLCQFIGTEKKSTWDTATSWFL